MPTLHDMMNRIAYAVADEGQGGGGDEGQGTGAPKTYSEDYVKQLRDEAKGYRIKLRETETDTPRLMREAAEAADRKTADAVKEAVTKLSADANSRIIRSELRAAALRAGIVDIDALKMLDASGVKVSADGDVEIPADFFEKAKAAKPYLFKATGADTGTTSSTQSAPKPAPTTVKSAQDLTPEEFAAEKRRLTGRK